MRVLLADPPAFTPWYDHELAAALARQGADVTVATSRFRFGDVPVSDGYTRDERYYRLSSRLFKRSRLRLPLKAVEHLGVLASLARARADIVHLQWLALPQADVRLRFRSPSVFTAHDLLPRRTAGKRDLWQRLLQRFDAVVVHTERGRQTLRDLGIDAHVIPHPVYPSTATRNDDGRTLLSLGVIRPYKGLPDAIEATRRLPEARLLVAGDPAMPLDGLRDAERVEWRLGYLPQAELDRALSEATVAVFPYRAELDQSGALLQALGAGVPAVVYDVGGLGEPVQRYGAGAVVPAGDVDAMTAAVRPPRGPGRTAARARRCGRRPPRADVGRVCRAAPCPLPGARMILRRARFAQVIESQLALFVREHGDVLEDVDARLRAYNDAGRDEAEELYGDYVDAVETGTELLADLRDHYAQTPRAAGALPRRVQPRRRTAVARVRPRDRESVVMVDQQFTPTCITDRPSDA